MEAALLLFPILLFCSICFGVETIRLDELVERGGLYYKKFTDEPFSGEVNSARNIGKIEQGKKQGYWIQASKEGPWFEKGVYRDGKKEGSWVIYYANGQIFSKGNYKSGERVNVWKW